jgi:F1F0 ATPase subunit 2
MNPTDALPWLLACAAGIALGVFFFWGLWWTVRKSLVSSRPALWVLVSLLLRTGVTVGGFYAVGGGDWQRLLACLIGFWVARQAVLRLTAAPTPAATKEISHAPQP